MNWRNVTPSNSTRFFVKGTELNNAIVPGTLSRFQICEIRCYDHERQADRRYAVRDAETVSDAQIHKGKRPEIVKWFDDENSAVEWCSHQK